MIKTINGIRYLTGTSAGSLYPVMCHDTVGQTFLAMGLRMELAKDCSGIMLYARVQTFPLDENGQPLGGDDYVVNMSAVAKKLKGLMFKVGSDHHISGPIVQGPVVWPKPEMTPLEKADFLAGMVFSATQGIAKKFGMTRLRSGVIKQIIRDRYVELTGDQLVEKQPEPPKVKDLPDVEDQLDASFDFLGMLGKSGPKPE